MCLRRALFFSRGVRAFCTVIFGCFPRIAKANALFIMMFIIANVERNQLIFEINLKGRTKQNKQV